MNKKNTVFAALVLGMLSVVLFVFLERDETVPTENIPPLGISPFIETQDLTFTTFIFGADTGISARLPSGTQVDIPGGLLVDADGNAVNGEVSLKIRELDSPYRMLQAGIPMQTTDRNYFSSAGMVEVRAMQDGEPLYCKPEGQYGIQLASNIAGSAPEYKLYRFKEDSTLSWEEAGEYQLRSNALRDAELTSIDSAIQTLSSTLPDRPYSPLPEDFVFTISGHAEYAMNAKALEGMDWLWIPETGEDPLAPPIDLLRRPWDEMSAADEGKGIKRFTFTMTKHQDGETTVETASILGKSVLKGRELKRRMRAFEEAQKEHEVAYAALQARETQLRLERNMIYAFQSSGFGLLNIDKLDSEDALMLVNATIRIDGKPFTAREEAHLWIVSEDENTVFRFPSNRFKSLTLPEGAFAVYLRQSADSLAYMGSLETAILVARLEPEPGFASPVEFDLIGAPESAFSALMQPSEPA